MNDENTLKQFDNLLAAGGPAALVIREHLIPVEGADAVLFPPTYAMANESGYNIDYENQRERTGRNICLIDSVGSQANRIEPLFKEEPYSKLVPQIVIEAGDKKINLLDAGHRAADALVRCSSLQNELTAAFTAAQQGNAALLAKIAPTSLVFGVWDSRDTQAKLPRLIASTIRAYDVRKLTRSAQYWAGGSSNPNPIYDDPSLLGPIADKNDKESRSTAGFTHVPSTGAHGGVIADGGIRRDAVLALSALKLLHADTSENTEKLRRYILGLALVAFTRLPLEYYRQGTILVLDPDPAKAREFKSVKADGTRTDVPITPEDALAYAQATAAAFGVGESKSVPFDATKAKAELKGGDDKKAKKAAKNKKAEASSAASESTVQTSLPIE